MAGRGGRSDAGLGVRPAPRAGAGPTIIAAALVVLVIGLGWLNHSGQAGEGDTPFARDVSRAIERAEAVGDIPGSEPATPSRIDGAGGEGASGRTTSTTVVVDPGTGLHVTVNLPGTTATTGSSSTAGATGTDGSATTGGTPTTPGTSGGSGTTDPPPTTGPQPTDPPTTGAPPSSEPPPSTEPPPPTEPPTTGTPPPTEPPPADDGGLLGGALGDVLGLLGL